MVDWFARDEAFIDFVFSSVLVKVLGHIEKPFLSCLRNNV